MSRYLLVGGIFAGVVGLSHAATIRPGGDPATQRVIWADTFDFYGQWAYDNSKTWVDFRGDPSGTPGPSGGLHNGPYPPGATGGSYPSKAPYCDVNNVSQATPAPHEMARAMWITTDRHKAFLGNAIQTPGGMLIDTGDFEANVDPGWCPNSGQFASSGAGYGEANYTWGTGGSYDAMTMFQHSFKDRIQAIDASKNAVNGTDAHPLVLVFYVREVQKLYPEKDNFYVELSLDGDHAPTDYVWRGDPNKNYPDPDGCPNGPFPIICQQTREINGSNSEDGTDLAWLNTACPPLSSKTWNSLAFGLLAIMDKDPCAILEQGTSKHVPAVDHYAYFDGNRWRQLRSARETGLAQNPPAWDSTGGLGGYDPNMITGSGGSSGNFSYPANGGDARVYMKITTNDMLLYVHSDGPAVDYGASIPRTYKGPFNMISIGVGPGCELDPATGNCKAGGTPRQPLTYSRISDGYNRTFVDSMSLYDGELVYNTTNGACCMPNGSCSVVDQVACTSAGGAFNGQNTTCTPDSCCATSPFVWADKDGDGDVDLDDFGAFQRCITGSAGGVPAGCHCFDRVAGNPNGIDQDDFTAFQNCVTGAGVIWTPALTPNCAP